MHWILPIALVMFAGLLIGAIHAALVRWMARQPGPALIRDPSADAAPAEDTCP
jgi:hypothetical protein